MSGPIIVVGSMGSGTTLMRLMLDSHPNIMIAKETGFMRGAVAQYSIPFWQFGDEWLERLDLTEADLDAALARFYQELFGKAAAKRGATRWGDKTPFQVHHMGLAARIFPDAKFVGTVRHPGAVAKSVERFNWTWASGIRTWRNSNQVMVDHGMAMGDRFLLTRYEDLVTDTERVLREVLDFVEEPWNPDVLEHHRHQAGRAEGGTQAHEPVDQSRMAKWLKATSAEQMADLIANTAGQARLFGYDSREPLPVSALNPVPDGPICLSGRALAEKYESLAPIPRAQVGHLFENGPYTQYNLAQELYKAYAQGRKGGRVRPLYRDMAESGKPVPSRRFISRARRRTARWLNPDKDLG